MGRGCLNETKETLWKEDWVQALRQEARHGSQVRPSALQAMLQGHGAQDWIQEIFLGG